MAIPKKTRTIKAFAVVNTDRKTKEALPIAYRFDSVLLAMIFAIYPHKDGATEYSDELAKLGLKNAVKEVKITYKL